MTNLTLGQRIAELRKKRNMKQSDLAEKLNVSTSTIAMWETGKRDPDTEKVNELASLFNVTTDYLLGRNKVQNIPIEDIAITQTEKDFLILARHAEAIPEEEKENLKNTIADTIEIYLSRINKKRGK